MPDTQRCGTAGHDDHRVRRAGRRGQRQRWECRSPEGERHWFTTEATDRRRHPVRCPEPGHADSRIQSRGTRTNSAGTWRRFRCQRANGDTHFFAILEATDNRALASLSRPPACPEHEGSLVVRYGPDGAKRQRYRCIPAGAADQTHKFVPPLSRQVVRVGADGCPTCDELLSPHRGTLTAARHTPWDLATFSAALNDLSLGQSYART